MTAISRRLRRLPSTIAAIALLALLTALLAGVAPGWLGYQSFVVYSGSMTPALGVGDLAVVAPVAAGQLQVGEVITYRREDNAGLAVTHRITRIEVDGDGNTSFETKGDANNSTDQVLVSERTVLGKVVYRVPIIGYLVDFARTPEGKIVLIGIPGLLLIGMDVLAAHRRPWRPGHAGASTALLARARRSRAEGDRTGALAGCDHALAADPRNVEAWLLKAECLDGWTEALACLQAGLTVNPSSERLRQAVERLTQTAAAAR